MVEKIASKIVNYMIVNKSIEEENTPYYRYGIEIMIAFMLNILLILTISLIFGNIVEGFVFLFIFISLRHFTGGYHADSYLSCNLKFSICFIALEIFFHLTYEIVPISILITTILFCIAIIVLECPIDNPNKPLKNNQKNRFKIVSILLSSIYSSLSLLLNSYNNRYGVFIIYTIFLVSILVIVAVLKKVIIEDIDSNSK